LKFKDSFNGTSATDLAVSWYKKSSAQGDGVASNNLGTIAHLQGRIDEARRWCRKATRQGFEHSPRLAQPRKRRKDIKA